jgi:copper(I)-binding protein
VLSEKGPHLLLKSVTWPIYNGDTTVCDLTFEHAGTVPVAVDATPQN